MSGEPVRLAVLGDPLRFTLSPELHRAGLRAAGFTGGSEAWPTPVETLGARLRELADRGYRGVNVTVPLKESALAHVRRVSPASRAARSINTIGFGTEGWWGDTTDGPGFLDLLATLGRGAARERCVLLGSGGAARGLAQALLGAGCAGLRVGARDPERARPSWDGLRGTVLVSRGSTAEREALAGATLVIHAAPVADEADAPPLDGIPRSALLVDLRYGPSLTEWVKGARAQGREAYDGLGLLVFQARRSLSLWLGCEVPVGPLAAAVGWPR